MANEPTNGITPFNPPNGKPSYEGLKKIGKKPILTGLQARLASAKKAEAEATSSGSESPETRTNRLALMLDVSGSMGGEKMDALKKATESFLQSLSLGPQGDTSIACETFPNNEQSSAACYPLTSDYTRALLASWQLTVTGSTPMAQALEKIIKNYPITRGILMSDGQPDSDLAATTQALLFKAAEVPIDCVHIGTFSSGEEFLKSIAELTGGLFIKFTDIDSFAKNFKYLSPRLRPLMLSGEVDAQQLGASELKGGTK